MVGAITLPDRVSTVLGATNIEPDLVDPKFDYVLLANSVEANLELFEQVLQRVKADLIPTPIWQGLMMFGTAELGTVFKIEKRRVPYSVEYPIKKQEGIASIEPPQQATGHLKMYFDITKELQRRHPDSLFMLLFDGPWDLPCCCAATESCLRICAPTRTMWRPRIRPCGTRSGACAIRTSIPPSWS